jgi:hypothetical protein
MLLVALSKVLRLLQVLVPSGLPQRLICFAADTIAKLVVAELGGRPLETLGHALRPQYAGVSAVSCLDHERNSDCPTCTVPIICSTSAI